MGKKSFEVFEDTLTPTRSVKNFLPPKNRISAFAPAFFCAICLVIDSILVSEDPQKDPHFKNFAAELTLIVEGLKIRTKDTPMPIRAKEIFTNAELEHSANFIFAKTELDFAIPKVLPFENCLRDSSDSPALPIGERDFKNGVFGSFRVTKKSTPHANSLTGANFVFREKLANFRATYLRTNTVLTTLNFRTIRGNINNPHTKIFLKTAIKGEIGDLKLAKDFSNLLEEGNFLRRALFQKLARPIFIAETHSR